jgi:hypothetical protein
VANPTSGGGGGGGLGGIPAAALSLVGAGLGALIGGKPKVDAAVPEDLKPMRQQQIGLLNYLLGMGRDPRGDGQTWQQRIPGYASYKPKQRAKLRDQWNTRADEQAMQQARSGAMMAAQPQQASPQFLPGVAGGPLVRMMADGGMVRGPGGPTDDMVPALLSNGEGVLNTDAVDAVGGPQIVHLLNALGRVQRMADGGIAGQKTPTLPGAGALPGGPVGTTTTPSGGGVGGLPVSIAPDLGGMPQTGGNLPRPQTGGMGGQQPMGGTLGAPAVQPNINLSGMGGMGGGQAGQSGGMGGGVMTPQQRLESFLGPLGIRPSNLQQAATAGYMGQLTNVSPEQRAAEITLPQLQQNLGGSPFTQQAMNRMMGLQAGAGADVEGRLGQLGTGPAMGSQGLQDVLSQLATGGGMSGLGVSQLQGLAGPGSAINFQGSGAGMGQLGALAGQNPGEQVMAALDPTFRRNLAIANQQGGRFGTANAALRARALEDFNLQSARALQEGMGQQIQAASNLGQIGTAQDQLRLNALLGNQSTQLSTQLGAATQLGNLGRQQDALRLEALGLTQRGEQGLTDAQLRALSQLGGFRQQEAQTLGNILQGAGQLGIQQGQMGTQAASTIANILGQQGTSDLARLQGAFGAGTTLTGLENAGQQRALDILLQQLGIAQGSVLGGPAMVTPGPGQQVQQAFNAAAGYLAGG